MPVSGFLAVPTKRFFLNLVNVYPDSSLRGAIFAEGKAFLGLTLNPFTFSAFTFRLT